MPLGLSSPGSHYSAHVPRAAQVDTAGRRVNLVALSAFGVHLRTGPAVMRSTQLLVFDPSIIGSWSGGVGIQPNPKASRHRDSTESLLLATALGSTLVRVGEVTLCAQLSEKCQLKPSEVLVIMVGEALIEGGRALTLVRTTAPYDRSGRITTARTATTSIVRLTRTAGIWAARCIALVATDVAISIATINATCPP